jgi:alpha-galactosidase
MVRWVGPVVLAQQLLLCAAVDSIAQQAAAARPPLGWSTWTTFKCAINETLVYEAIDAMLSSGLAKSGYEYVLCADRCPALSSTGASGACWLSSLRHARPGRLAGCLPDRWLGPWRRRIDDCWTAPNGQRSSSTGEIVIDPTRFPHGFEPLTQYAHARKLKMGIYTSVGKSTCAGFTGSLHHEAGFDFVKHDTCMSPECSVHNGCVQNATRRMRDALHDAGNGEIVYYLDAGNPTNVMKLFNPKVRKAPRVSFESLIQNLETTV